jgi:putative intracellular protease/amidase
VLFALESKRRGCVASLVGVPHSKGKIAVSERLLLGRNPASATGVVEAVVALLEGSRHRH